MKINSVFFERLIRASERLAILRRIVSNESGSYISKQLVADICGEVIPVEESEKHSEFPTVEELEDLWEDYRSEDLDIANEDDEVVCSFEFAPEEDVPKEEAEKEAVPEVKAPKKSIDREKVYALADAGWSQKQIAEEMRCAKSSISIILSNRKRGAKV